MDVLFWMLNYTMYSDKVKEGHTVHYYLCLAIVGFAAIRILDVRCYFSVRGPFE